MLPGFRFLFAAIMLSMSFLIFGLGAAALLRTAHEEFASNPSWRAAPEVTFAQQTETARPVLATLRVDMSVAEKVQDDAAATAAPVEQAAIASAPADPERATLKPEDSSAMETARAETVQIPVTESPAAGEAAPSSAEMPALASETKIAAIATEEVARESQPVTASFEQTGAQVAPDADIATTKIATLDGPPVNIETPPAKVSEVKVSDAKSDQGANRKRLQARRAAHRRRVAAARAQLTAAQTQQQANPFFQPASTVRSR